MKFVVFNLRHGANLGDQLIAQCLEAELRAANPKLEIVNEDIAGRDAPQTGLGSRWQRVAALTILGALPQPMRRFVAGKMLDRLIKRRLLPRWRAIVSDADAVIIGGGGVFADSDLNFPKKISAALRVASERDIAVAIHAVGVSPHWSRVGRQLFHDGLATSRLASLSVRDSYAREIWNAELPSTTLQVPTIAPDPALTLASHFRRVVIDHAATPAVGLCLTSTTALRYHASNHWPPQGLSRWYCDVARELTSRGYRVVGFTTGAIEDERFADGVRDAILDATEGRACVFSRGYTTGKLVELIGGCRAIVAHRLHALITGYVLGVPGLALEWDPKMIGQMATMGHSDRLVNSAETTAIQVADRIETIIAEGVNVGRREALIEEVRESTKRLIESLCSMATNRV